jgi:hypothetical protein
MNPSRPISHGDGASGTAHSQQFAGHEFRPRGKHRSEQASYDVEAGILKWECFGVAFPETGIETFCFGARLRTLHQVRRDVHAGDVHSIPRCPQRDLTRAASKIEHLAASGYVELFVENARSLFHN